MWYSETESWLVRKFRATFKWSSQIDICSSVEININCRIFMLTPSSSKAYGLKVKITFNGRNKCRAKKDKIIYYVWPVSNICHINYLSHYRYIISWHFTAKPAWTMEHPRCNIMEGRPRHRININSLNLFIRILVALWSKINDSKWSFLAIRDKFASVGRPNKQTEIIKSLCKSAIK